MGKTAWKLSAVVVIVALILLISSTVMSSSPSLVLVDVLLLELHCLPENFLMT
jgi:hypothetical protein